MGSLKVKTISFKPNGDKPGENSGFDPLYGGEGENIIPFPRDRITPWWKDEDEAKLSIDPEDYPLMENISIEELIKQGVPISEMVKRREGIISHLAQMTDTELRELYGGYLVPYGYKEDDIMKMPMKELEYLFNQVMNI
jgi:hypothetical protein